MVDGICQVGRNDLRLWVYRFGLGRSEGGWGVGFGGCAFSVGQGRRASAHVGVVDLLEGQQGPSG
ncbi:hypothetical protein [Streptomyces sp. T028]|uniref:hypothetical protein n=1 Tax=Streptomyces sp. T028 TaxID=3394379 RepID=UPI003A86EBD0